MNPKTKEELLAELAELEAKEINQQIEQEEAEIEKAIVEKLKEVLIPPEPVLVGKTAPTVKGHSRGAENMPELKPAYCEHLRPRTDNTEATCFLYRAHPNKQLAFDPRSAPDKCTSKLTGCTDYE